MTIEAQLSADQIEHEIAALRAKQRHLITPADVGSLENVLAEQRAIAALANDPVVDLSDPIVEPGALFNPLDPSTEFSLASGFKSDVADPIPGPEPVFVPSEVDIAPLGRSEPIGVGGSAPRIVAPDDLDTDLLADFIGIASDGMCGFTYEDLNVLASLPIGGSVTRVATGWRYAPDASGTKTETASSIEKSSRLIGAMREVGPDGVVRHVTQSGDVIV